MTDSDDALTFQAALDGEADEYLEAEATLRRSTSAKNTLEPALHDPDPIARLMAEVFLDASEAENDPYGAVEDYLAAAEEWFADTILGSPPVGGIVDNLTATFGGSLAGYLALRLVKVPTAPMWRQQVILSYLEHNPTPAATDALLRYASATPVPELQRAVARVVRAAGDTALASKVAAERERLARDGRKLPRRIFGDARLASIFRE